MTKSTLLLFGFLTSLSFSCKKNQDIPDDDTTTLPPATMTGANIFGCLVNGEVWLPGKGSLWNETLNVKHDRGWIGCDQLLIGATKDHATDELMGQQFTINAWCPVIGENTITPINSIFIDFGNCGNYRVDTLSSHIMTITKLDTLNFIAAGTFSFTAINDDCQDTLRVTEGRFDADSHL